MSILARQPAPTEPSSSPSSSAGRPAEAPEARAARLRLRRRMILWSLPVAVLLLVVAVKLLSVVALGEQAQAAFAGGNITGVDSAASRLGVVNVVEPHKAPFARGDARVLAGDYDGARVAFEEAMALAPRDSQDQCQIRVNLVQSLLRLGQAARQSGGPDAATPYANRVDQVVEGAPQGCFQGPTGDQLRNAQQQAQQQRQPDQQQQSQGQQDPQPQDGSAQQKQQQLDQQTRDNLQQRGQGDQPGDSSRIGVEKPW